MLFWAIYYVCGVTFNNLSWGLMMFSQKKIFLVLITAVLLGLSGCGGGSSNNATTESETNSFAQKGPFVKGSEVRAYELVDGERTAKSASAVTYDNSGQFSLNTSWTGITELVITGSYLNENTGDLRADGILSAIINSESGRIFGRNINIFTHIAAERIKVMLKQGSDFEEAKEESSQLLKEMFNLNLVNGVSLTYLNVITDNANTTKADNAQLLKISAALLNTDNPAALLEALREDIKDGKIDGAGVGAIDEIIKKIATLDLFKIDSILGSYTGRLNSIPSSTALLAGKLPLSANISFHDVVDAEPGEQLFTKRVALVGFEGNVTASGNDGYIMVMHSDGTTDSKQADILQSVEAGSSLGLTALASSSFSTTKTIILDISGRKFEWNITTKTNPNAVDTTPNSFDLGIASNIVYPNYAQSEEITVSGLSEGIYVEIAIVGGNYSLNGNPPISTSSRVANGDKVVVSASSSHSYLGENRATLNIGGVTGDFAVFTRARKVTPVSFTPQTQYNVELNTSYETAYFLMSGYEGGLDLDVVNGEAQLDGETSWTTHMSDFPAGYKVKFRQLSSNEYNTQKETTIRFGALETSFKTITQENPSLIDTIPNPVTFTTLYNAKPINEELISDEVVISGISGGTGATLSMNSSGDHMQINDGEWRVGPISGIKAGDRVRVKIKNVDEGDTYYAVELRYLDTNATYKTLGMFKAYTATTDRIPESVSFVNVEDANLSELYFSNEITISGLDDDATISATILGHAISSNYQYSINSSSWENAPVTVELKNGDTVELKAYSSSIQGKSDSMFLNFNDKSVEYRITTNIAPEFVNRPSFESIEVGDTISFTPDIRDTQVVTFSIENAPSWLELNATTGKINGTVASGSYEDVKLIATDSGGLSGFISFDLVADIAPLLSSTSFGKEFILDDASSMPNQYNVDFKISDVDTDLSDLIVTKAHAITESRVSSDGLSRAFSESRIICDAAGNCSAQIAIEFTRADGLHPSLKTRHTITVSDGVKSATNYVDIWYAPTSPQLSGSTDQRVAFTSGIENEYEAYAFVPTNSANKAERWTVANKPEWASFNTATGELTGTPALDQNGTYSNVQISAFNDRGSDIFAFNIVVKDKTPPSRYTFRDYDGVEIQQFFDSSITVDWLVNGESASISSSGYNGQPTHSGFIVNGIADVTTVQNGDIVTVWHKSSNEYATTLDTTITIGSDSDTFSTTTKQTGSTKLPLIVGAPNTRGNIYEEYSYIPQLSTDYAQFAPVTKPFVIENKPAWASFNADTGELIGTPDDEGEYKNVKIIAYGDAGLDTIVFTITIRNDGPYINGSNHSLENDNLEFTFNDNSDWRGKINGVEMYSCYGQGTPAILDASDYTFSEGRLSLHVSTSSNVALHMPVMGGGRLIVKANGYQDSEAPIDMIADGKYGVRVIASTNLANKDLNESNLDGAIIDISLLAHLEFLDSNLDITNFNLSAAPTGTALSSVTWLSETTAQITLAFNGIDFDENKIIKIGIDSEELNICESIPMEANDLNVEAVIEPIWSNLLYPDSPQENGKFGLSVDIKNSTLAVASSDSVYIFNKDSNGDYQQEQEITGASATSLSIDGDYLVIGESKSNQAGKASVYKKDGDDIYQFLQDITPAGLGDLAHFGHAADMSEDLIIVGAYNDDEHKGRAYLFQNDGNDNFILKETISRVDGKEQDSFGFDVAIDGDYFLVGSMVVPFIYTDGVDNKEELGAGFANYYNYLGNNLELMSVISPNDSNVLADHFGQSVSIYGDHLAIGAPGNNDNGSVYVYKRAFNTVTDNGKIEGSIASELFGSSVAIYHNVSSTLAIGTANAGNAYSFVQHNSTSFTGYKSTFAGDDRLGYRVAIDDNEVAYGMYANDDEEVNAGAVLVTNVGEEITAGD